MTGAPDRSARSATPGRPRSRRPRTLKGPSGKMPTTRPVASARGQGGGVERGGARPVAGFIARSTTAGEPVPGDGGVVLFDRRREVVAAIVHRDEVEVLHRRGVERGCERLQARTRDRPRRE